MVLKPPTKYMHIETLVLNFKPQNLLRIEVATNLTSSFLDYRLVPWPLAIHFRMIDQCFGS